MRLTKRSGIDYEDIEYLVLNHGIAYERAESRNGFVIATRISAECMSTGRITERTTEDSPENPFDS